MHPAITWHGSNVHIQLLGSVGFGLINEVYAYIWSDKRFASMTYILWDTRLVSSVEQLTEKEIQLISMMDAKKASQKKALKVAVLSESPEIDALLRMYKAMMKDTNWEISEPFRNIEEALAWCDL
jgi:hypothetical protein